MTDFCVSSDDLVEVIKIAQRYNPYVVFNYLKDSLVVSAASTTSTYEATIKVKKSESDADAVLKLHTDYLLNCISEADGDIRLKILPNKPIVMFYSFGKTKAVAFVAPYLIEET